MFDGIAQNLLKPASCLLTLHIVAMNIDIKSWQSLSQGFRSNNCKIQTFKLNLCFNLTDRDVQTILQGFWQSKWINTIDLSRNNLEDSEKIAEAISRLIVNQGEMRDMMKWSKNLRLSSNQLSVSDTVGLKKLDLSNNCLGSQFMVEVGQIIQFDQYLISIDLSSNNVCSNDISKRLIDSMSQNYKLREFNLKGNPCSTN